MEIKEIFEWFKTPKAASIFSIAGAIGGIFFINTTITGNVINNNYQNVDLISLIGIMLIFCSALLGFYAIKNRS